MKRIAIVSAEFGDKIFDFKLYAHVLLTYEGFVSVEYTEKVCDETVRIYTMQHNAPKLAEEMTAEAVTYTESIQKRVEMWDELADETVEGVNDE